MGGVKVMILYSSGLLIGCHIQNKTRDKRRHENNLSLLENGRRHAVQTAAVFLSIFFSCSQKRTCTAPASILCSFFPPCHFKRRVKTTDASFTLTHVTGNVALQGDWISVASEIMKKKNFKKQFCIYLLFSGLDCEL